MTQIYIKFGKKDEDLKRWRIALKKTGFPLSVAVSGIILNEISSIGFWLPTLVIDKSAAVPDVISSKLTVTNEEVEDYLCSVKKNQLSSEIKKLIRKHITEHPSCIKTIEISDKKLYNTNKTNKKAKRKAKIQENKVPDAITPSAEAETKPRITHITTVIEDEENEMDFDFSRLLSLAGEE